MSLGLVLGLGVTAGLIATAGAAGALAKARLRARYQPPGRMVDVGGCRLHLECVGDGPTVVLESGLGAEAALSWVLVRPQVAKFARVCSYDRAGYGWSDASPRPRTAGVMVEELRSLLTAAEVPPPYVLVAHSFGGLVSRLYAATHPEEIAGLVLVDSAHEDQMERFPQEVVATVDLQKMLKMMSALGRVYSTGIPALFYKRLPLQAPLPEPAARTARALLARGGRGMATLVAEQRALEESQDQVRAASGLGELPLVVLSHGRPAPLPRDPAITPEVERRYEEVWQELQAELAALTPKGELVVAAESGHAIQLDQPDLVVDAIRRVVEAARAEAAGTAPRAGRKE